MKIALVHSFYSRSVPSGENDVVERQLDALTHRGHDVLPIFRETDDRISSGMDVLRSGLRVATGMGDDVLAEHINAFAADVVHVHNLFPNYGHRWLDRTRAPVVATVHNFRPLCANGLLFRQGKACTECLDRGTHRALVHGCYRDSRLATLPLWLRNPRGVIHDPLLTRSRQVIFLSDRVRKIFVGAGLDDDKSRVLPNPVLDHGVPATAVPTARRWAVAARLTEQKGVADLLRAWPRGEPLDVIGSGEHESLLQRLAPASVRFLGRLDNADLRRRLPTYTGLIIPSLSVEAAAPLVYLEALAAGVPVICRRDTSVGDQVLAEGTGVTIEALEPPSLRAALARVISAGTDVRTRCRHVFETTYTIPRWIDRLEATYAEARSLASARTGTAYEHGFTALTNPCVGEGDDEL